MSPTIEQIRAMPKVLLHDHLDGGLRPGTVIDLADDIGYLDLPTHDPAELTQVLTAGDMSCLMHLEGLIRRRGISMRVMHLAQILAGENEF